MQKRGSEEISKQQKVRKRASGLKLVELKTLQYIDSRRSKHFGNDFTQHDFDVVVRIEWNESRRSAYAEVAICEI